MNITFNSNTALFELHSIRTVLNSDKLDFERGSKI